MHDYLPMHHGDDLIGCSNFRTQCSIDDLEIQETAYRPLSCLFCGDLIILENDMFFNT
ncbi:hypothetical protein EfmAA610_07310 [Enterococcus faecium]|nr:hypothetical protein EfmAA610_07310 [Enterococcus faecium]